MKPNDLPLVCLPMDLSAAAKLIEFLYELVEALESHYAGQLLPYAHRYDPESSPPDTATTNPPF